MGVHLFHNFKYMVSISAFWVWDIYILKFWLWKYLHLLPSLGAERFFVQVFSLILKQHDVKSNLRGQG